MKIFNTLDRYIIKKFLGTYIFAIILILAITVMFDINEKLVPYAMLEELLVGGNVKPYLTGTVLENCDKLPSFFGDFIGVMPPPFFRNSQEVGLIYKNATNKYTVEYFTFEYTEKKLSGIKKE